MSYPQETFVTTTLAADSLLYKRREAVAANTLLYQLDVLKKTGRYDCFKLEWHSVYARAPEVWPVPDHLFWDSDVAKWIEGACYLLHDHPNPKIDAAIQELVAMIRSAQHEDGYLNLHYTMVEPGKRFTNLRDMHELYNAGHMIEAALAHQYLYHNDQLMGPILKYTGLLCKTFGPAADQIHGYPGHPEIELALLRLYHRTGMTKYRALAEYFITERGNPSGVNGEHYYDVELRARGDDPNKRPSYHTEVGGCKWYYGAHLPLAEQQSIEGHSVRAMYLLTAAADLTRGSSGKQLGANGHNSLQPASSATTNPDIQQAVYRLWNNMVDRKMYVTGGIGSIKQYEGFGEDYFLPEGTDEGGCYAETCASIGTMMLAQRILQYDLDSKYTDIMELCLYNAVLTAMSSDGKAFTYVNQLASSDADPCKRCDWFTVACCPPNTLRLLGQLSGYIYDETATGATTAVNVHLYIPSVHNFQIDGTMCSLKQESDYPWNGDISFSFDTPSNTDLEIRVRIPAFASNDWAIDPPASDAQVRDGYLYLSSSYLKANKSFKLSLPLRPRLIAPHPFATNSNTLTLARGPIVYCVEDVDNSWVTDHFKSTQISKDCLDGLVEQKVQDEKTGDQCIALKVVNGASLLNIDGIEENRKGMPFVDVLPKASSSTASATNGMNGNHKARPQGPNDAKPLDELNFVPFYFRANRPTRGQCRVGLRRQQS